MTAAIIPFARPGPSGAPQSIAACDGAKGHARAMLDLATGIFPLLELAYHALDRDDLATASACLDELQETVPPDGAPLCAIDWRDRQIEALTDSVMLIAALRGRSAEHGNRL